MHEPYHEKEVDLLFKQLDKDESGYIDYKGLIFQKSFQLSQSINKNFYLKSLLKKHLEELIMFINLIKDNSG